MKNVEHPNVKPTLLVPNFECNPSNPNGPHGLGIDEDQLQALATIKKPALRPLLIAEPFFSNPNHRPREFPIDGNVDVNRRRRSDAKKKKRAAAGRNEGFGVRC